MKALVFLALAACDHAFGIEKLHPADASADATRDAAATIDGDQADDLDGDSVPDALDPCIAPASDFTADLDADLLPNGGDPCPFDVTTSGEPDLDGDGIPDTCDPMPNHANTQRCVMAFTSTSFNATFWRSRGSERPLDNSPGALSAHGAGLSVTVAARPIEVPNGMTSYDADIDVATDTLQGSVAIWPRIDPDASATSDVGCILYYYAGVYGYGVFIQGAAMDAHVFNAPGTTFRVRLRASMTPPGAAGMSTIRCSATASGAGQRSAEAVMTASIVDGTRFGISTDTWQVTVHGVDVFTD